VVYNLNLPRSMGDAAVLLVSLPQNHFSLYAALTIFLSSRLGQQVQGRVSTIPKVRIGGIPLVVLCGNASQRRFGDSLYGLALVALLPHLDMFHIE